LLVNTVAVAAISLDDTAAAAAGPGQIPELIRTCVLRYMREALPVTLHPPPAAACPSAAAAAALAAGDGGAGGAVLLAGLRRLTQSLLAVCPEAFRLLDPDVQVLFSA
jgi:hypothetical protein